MSLSKLVTTMFDELSNQISIKVLSSCYEVYVVWKEKDETIMEVHYCKKDDKLNLLDGSLGLIIKKSNLSELEKISKCSEAIEKAIMTQKSLANIKRQKDLINKNNEFIGENEKLINRSKIT